MRLKGFFWATDLGFLLYWIVSFLGRIPIEYRYQDYTDANLADSQPVPADPSAVLSAPFSSGTASRIGFGQV